MEKSIKGSKSGAEDQLGAICRTQHRLVCAGIAINAGLIGAGLALIKTPLASFFFLAAFLYNLFALASYKKEHLLKCMYFRAHHQPGPRGEAVSSYDRAFCGWGFLQMGITAALAYNLYFRLPELIVFILSHI